MYDSITLELFALPSATLVYPGHDYKGRTVSTIGEERQFNPRLAGVSRDRFIEIMNHLNLPNPRQIAAAVPANEQCGQLVTAS
jgi:glyoxylase-like metal-dependent hydrolase (beta-lactamase superfamily II)